MLSLGFLILYLEKKAQRGKKENLKEVIKEISERTLPETDPAETSQRIGQSSVLLIASEFAEDLKQLEKGDGEEEIKTWIERISAVLKTPPLINDLSENLVAVATAFVNRVLGEEKEKESPNQK